MPRKFDFVSPGISLEEVDQSVLESPTGDDGLLLIGRAPAGPAMQPTKIKNLRDYLNVFGAPISGKGTANNDIWRDGNQQAPTYAAYAAQAWLASETSPVTFVRLLGHDSEEQATGYVKAGWDLDGASLNTAHANNVTAYGLFIMPSASAAGQATGSLAAIIYATGSSITLSGTIAGGELNPINRSTTTSSAGCMIESVSTSGVANTFILEVRDSAVESGYVEKNVIHFDPSKKDGFIRNVLNTNPLKTYSTNYGSSNMRKYFLGETYEEAVQSLASGSTAGKQFGMILPLCSGSSNMLTHQAEATAAKSGWVINRDPNPQENASAYSSDQMKKLFRFVSLHEGEWFQANYYITIEDLKLGTVTSPNSTFTVSVRKVGTKGEVVEQFSGCNLDESSEGFIGKKIGDMYQTWNTTNMVFDITGDYLNRSDFIRVEMSEDWKSGIDDAYMLPWGFFGPVRPKGFTVTYGSSGAQSWGDDTNTGVYATGQVVYTGDHVDDGGKLIFNHPNGLIYEVRAAATANSTAWTKDASAAKTYYWTVDTRDASGTGNDHTKYATKVTEALTLLPGYTASRSSATVTVIADAPGSHFTWTWTESGDDSNRQAPGSITAGTDTDDGAHVYVKGNANGPNMGGDAALFAVTPMWLSASFEFPRLKLTEQSTNKASANYRNTEMFGVRHKFASKNEKGVMPKRDYLDLLRYQGGGIDLHATANATEYSFVFSLDEIIKDANGLYYWSSGSHTVAQYQPLRAISAASGTAQVISDKVRQFALPMFGGFDGVDIRLADPFSSAVALAGKQESTSYAYYSVSKAIDLCNTAESVKFDVISMPGLLNETLTNDLIRTVETRADSLAIIDLDDGFLESYENDGTRTGGTLTSVKSNADGRDYNTSYAATYFPRVRLRDTLGGNGDVIVAPASVAALGALAFSDSASGAPWFAPAGFNRGGLSQLGGVDGPKVIGAYKQLSKSNRDELYERNINPVARFPAIGETVIFGQKTLQQTRSALDRINVRRLMIFLKKRVGKVAETILFDQNVHATWNRFKAGADLILRDAQSRLGITQYKLVLDETTTTADLVDQNIMYAKVFIKPARAIEYIAIDFIVTRSGVEF